MLVSFNPMINTAATADAAYMNFLRCVKAICTAAQGTTSLTVNPTLAINGTSDNTRNCILQIFANSEAGGWTESTSSNVIQPGTSFTAIASMTAFQYKFDAYNSSGKGSLPFNKLCFHANGSSSGCTWYGQRTLPTQAQFASYPQVLMTFGASTTSDWTDTRFIPGGRADSNGAMNGGYNTAGASSSNNQNQSSTCNGFMSTSSSYYGLNSMNVYALNRIFYLSVTASYCILWEQPANNSYTVAPFYANDIQLNTSAGALTGQSPINSNSSYTSPFYGSLYYGGLRETQAWENAISTNPPWVVMQYGFHRFLTPPNSTTSTMNTTANFMSASLCTINDTGVVNTTPVTYVISNTSSSPGNNFDLPAGHNQSYNLYVATRGGAQNHTGDSPGSGILSPFITKDFTGQPSYASASGSVCNTNQLYMPTVDPVTGTAVPSAFPIVARRLTTNSWTPGGAIRGLYRSLAMPIATMRNYFAPGQTFNIYNSVTATTDTYIPIIFNEDMFLVRYA
jgi:hypothetical protein